MGFSASSIGVGGGQVTIPQLAPGTQGDVLYADAGGVWTKLVAGTTGQFLKTQGAAANPIWAAAGGSGNFTYLGTTTLGSANAGISLASIPTGYKVLFYVLSGGATSGGPNITMKINTSTLTTMHYIASNGSTVSGGTTVVGDITDTNAAGSTYFGWVSNTPNAIHTALVEGMDSSGYQFMSVGRWTTTTEANEIGFAVSASTFVAGTTLQVWGLT